MASVDVSKRRDIIFAMITTIMLISWIIYVILFPKTPKVNIVGFIIYSLFPILSAFVGYYVSLKRPLKIIKIWYPFIYIILILSMFVVIAIPAGGTATLLLFRFSIIVSITLSLFIISVFGYVSCHCKNASKNTDPPTSDIETTNV